MEFYEFIEELPRDSEICFFIGSGFSKRYANAPSWEGLLKNIAKNRKIDFDTFVEKYKDNKNDLALIAEKLEEDIKNTTKDIDEEIIKKETINILNNIHENVNYISDEMLLFKQLMEKTSIIVTTNYDKILETLMRDFNPDIHVSQPNKIDENKKSIYKIHGCISDKESIVIKKSDYEKFKTKKYLQSKLLTSFVEKPVIFVEYSMNDENIKKIIFDLIQSFDEDNLNEIKNKWLFVEYAENEKDIIFEKKEIALDGNVKIEINTAKTDNYEKIYKQILTIWYDKGIFLDKIENKIMIIERLISQYVNKTIEEDILREKIKKIVLEIQNSEKSNENERNIYSNFETLINSLEMLIALEMAMKDKYSRKEVMNLFKSTKKNLYKMMEK